MPQDPRPLLAGRYRVLKELSSRSESRVLEVEDTSGRGEKLALKILQLPGRQALEQARREYEAQRQLSHPGIAEARDFGRLAPGDLAALGLAGGAQSEVAYLASSFYEGLSLREAFLLLFPGDGSRSLPGPTDARAWTPPQDPRWRVFLEALARVCDALSAIHARGLIHFDIKPENVLFIPVPMVRGNGRSKAPPEIDHFEVKIIDFGLAGEEATPLGRRVRGTIPYLAPELLESAHVDHRADLFSLGVAMAFAIAGRFPFPGSQPERWISASRQGKLLDLQKLRPDLPRGLGDLIEALLNPRPSERPQTASEVRALLEQAGGFRLPSTAPLERRKAPCVGRERELSLVRREIDSLKRGEADRVVILFTGDSGQSLDTLLDEVEVLARVEGASVISTSASLPRRHAYQPFAAAIPQLLRRAPLPPERLERYLGALALFAPAEGPVSPQVARRSTLPPLKPRAECFRFLDLVTEVFLDAAREAPLVLCIRGLDLAGRESIELLRFLARNVHQRRARREMAPETDPARLLIIATMQEPQTALEPGLAGPGTQEALAELTAEPFVETVRVEGLGLDRIAEWLRARIPGVDLEGDQLRRLHEKTGGAPWLLEELALRVEAAGETNPQRAPGAPARVLEVDPQILLRLPRNPGEAALERARALPAPLVETLEILAAARSPLSLRELAATEEALGDRGEASAPLSTRIERLHEVGLVTVRTSNEGLSAEVSHPDLSTELYRQMAEERRTAAHRALALVLLERAGAAGPGRAPEDVAHHAGLAGLTSLYFSQALLAADRLHAAHAHDAATRLYEEVLERGSLLGGASDGSGDAGPSPGPGDPRAHACERLAAIQAVRGHPGRAIEKLTFLAASDESGKRPGRLAWLFRTLGELYEQVGEPANAVYFFERSLKSTSVTGDGAGESPPPEVLQARLATWLALGRYQLGRDDLVEASKVLAKLRDAARPEEAHRDVLARAMLLLAEVGTRRGDHGQSLARGLEALHLAREESAQALAIEALTSIGRSYQAMAEYDRALEHFEKGLELALRLESKFDAAALHNSIGTLHHNRGDHVQALDWFTRALVMSSQLGDVKGIANSYNNLGIVHWMRDDLENAANCYKRAIDIFSRLNDQNGMATGMSNLASILEHEGRYNEALDYSFRALEKRKKLQSSSGMAFTYYRIGKIYQAKGELDRAATYAEKSLQIRAEIGERLGLAYARLLLAEVRACQGRIAESLEHAEFGLREFEGLGNPPGVLLARAALARSSTRAGDTERSLSLLESVLGGAEASQQTNLAGRALLDQARAHLLQGNLAAADGLVARAEAIFRNLKSRRELAEALLEGGAVLAAVGRPDGALDALDEAYSLLEDLEIRDLVPHYFLLRGRLAARSEESADREAARKYFERGLIEARELHLLDLQWQLHLEKGRVEARLGADKIARIHYQEARNVLETIRSNLPAQMRGAFYDLESRREPERLLGKLGAGGQVGEEAPAHGEAGGPVEPGSTEGRSRLEDALKLQRESLKLHQVAAALGTERDLQKLLELVLDSVIGLVDAERGFLILRGGLSGQGPPTETVLVARNLDREEILDPRGKISGSILREALSSGKPVLLGSALEKGPYRESRSVREMRLLSLVCVPLRYRNETLGLIYLDNRHRRDAFRQGELNLLTAFADQASVAVINARLLEENVRKANELLEANQRMEAMNANLESAVKERNEELAIAREDLRNRQDQLEARHRFQNIVGTSEAMRQIFGLLEKVAPTQLAVLLEGESGTGKELLARAIHFNGPRRRERFVSINCGALSEPLLESELFGHVRGAFTGAIQDKRGLFETADRGTIFLDEVSDMSLSMQQKLLRVLQEGELRRVGGKENVRVDVRVISASNQRLMELVARRRFREDLYYRINGFRLVVPSLRERKEDIPILVDHFVELAQKPGEARRTFSQGALRALVERAWPGNVRELRNLIERTLVIAPGPIILEKDLLFDGPAPATPPPGSGPLVPAPARSQGLPAAPTRTSLLPGDLPLEASLRAARNAFEKELLARRLAEAEGNIAGAARLCKVTRESMYRLIKKHKLPLPGARQETLPPSNS